MTVEEVFPETGCLYARAVEAGTANGHEQWALLVRYSQSFRRRYTDNNTKTKQKRNLEAFDQTAFSPARPIFVFLDNCLGELTYKGKVYDDLDRPGEDNIWIARSKCTPSPLPNGKAGS